MKAMGLDQLGKIGSV